MSLSRVTVMTALPSYLTLKADGRWEGAKALEEMVPQHMHMHMLHLVALTSYAAAHTNQRMSCLGAVSPPESTHTYVYMYIYTQQGVLW
jgi:hydroxypyruvate isomerase